MVDKTIARAVFVTAVLTSGAVVAEAAIPRPEYPRPQFVRGEWRNLNGDAWTFTFDQGPNGVWHHPNHRPHSAEYGGQPYVNDEFGGIVYVPPERRTEEDKKKSWGYGSRPNDPEQYYALIKAEVDVQNAVPTLSGWCFTQLYDVEQERNGIYTYDRTPKFDMKRIREIFSAPASGR